MVARCRHHHPGAMSLYQQTNSRSASYLAARGNFFPDIAWTTH
jgi:hypothetical protein